MTLPNWHEEPIAKRHNRKGFDCGQAVPRGRPAALVPRPASLLLSRAHSSGSARHISAMSGLGAGASPRSASRSASSSISSHAALSPPSPSSPVAVSSPDWRAGGATPHLKATAGPCSPSRASIKIIPACSSTAIKSSKTRGCGVVVPFSNVVTVDREHRAFAATPREAPEGRRQRCRVRGVRQTAPPRAGER